MILQARSWRFLAAALALSVALVGTTQAQSIIFSEDFEGLDLGPNVDEGLNQDDPRDEVWSAEGPEGWTVDNTDTPAGGVLEFRGWNFMDPIWWSETAGDQERSFFAIEADFVAAIADGDEWDDAGRDPGDMNTFLSTPPISLEGVSDPTLEFLSSWRPDGTQVATVGVSYDGAPPVEVLRYESDSESDFFQPDANPEDVSIPLDVPAGAQEAVVTFGYTQAQNHWWWAIDNISLGDYEEDFEGVALGPNVQEGRAVPVDDVWTKTPPAGWSIEDMVPGQDEENDNNGVTEWIGWSFTDKDWWVGVAGDQNRSEFTNGEGTVAVADPDEWDDADHPPSDVEGWYNTFMSTGDISLDGVTGDSVELKFDSSWRDEFDSNYQQSANVQVAFDGGDAEEILLWLSDPDADEYKPAATNEEVVLDIDIPDGASSMVITWGMFDAGNDWWWAIDNIEVRAEGGGNPFDYSGDNQLTVADVDELLAAIKNGSADAQFDVNGDGMVDAADVSDYVSRGDILNSYVGDANLDGEFNSGDLVDLFVAGEYEDGVPMNSTWSTGDFNGDGEFGSGDLVAAFVGGGYEAGPRAATAAVPEPAAAGLLLIGALCVAVCRRK